MTDALASSNSGSGATTTSASGTSTTTGTGLGQGINVQQFVQYAVANQQATITNLQSQEATLGTQQTELATLGSQFTALDNAIQALNDPLGAMGAETVSSSDSSLVQATASSAASPGTHTISINNLATTASWYTDEVASGSTPLATGDTLNIYVGGSSTPVASVTTDSSTNTLASIAQAINNQTTAVHASVVTDANGARLSLVSATSGQPGDISVSGVLHDTTNSNAVVNFNQAVQGKNASLYVDGMPVSSTSNTVSGVIPGVTLSLLGPTATNNPVSLNVSQDTSQATAAINSFVSAYNAVTTEINNQFNVTSSGGGGPLENDDSLRQVQSMLLSAISYSMTGNNGIVNLASMGINMNDDGTLTVDNSALASALASNYSAVQNFFQNASSGFAQQLDNALQTINAPTTGMLAIDAQSLTSTSQDLNQQITDLQAALTVQEQQLTATYSQVNTTLQELPMLENQLSQQLASIA